MGPEGTVWTAGAGQAPVEFAAAVCTISSFDVCLLTRTRHRGRADLLVEQALELERATMRRLGDRPELIEFDIADLRGEYLRVVDAVDSFRTADW